MAQLFYYENLLRAVAHVITIYFYLYLSSSQLNNVTIAKKIQIIQRHFEKNYNFGGGGGFENFIHQLSFFSRHNVNMFSIFPCFFFSYKPLNFISIKQGKIKVHVIEGGPRDEKKFTFKTK